MTDFLRNDIARFRSDKKVSQQELANAISVSRKTISTVETGRFMPSVVIALKLANYFGVAVEDLFELAVKDDK